MAHRLQPGEQVRVRTRTHARGLLKPAVWLIVLCLAAGIWQGYLSRPDLPFWVSDYRGAWQITGYIVLGLLLFFGAVRPLWRWLTRVTYLTTLRVSQRIGWLRVQRRWLTLEAIERVQMRQSRRQRWVRRGDLQLWSYSGHVWTLRNLPEIQRFTQLVEAELYSVRARYGYGYPGVAPNGPAPYQNFHDHSSDPGVRR